MSDEADVQVSPEPEAEKSLDELLGEFNEPTPPTPRPKPDAMSEVVDFVRDLKTEREQKGIETGISTAVQDMMKEDALSKLDPDVVEGYLHVSAFKNASFRKAFDTRETNPAAWNKAVSNASQELSKKMNLPDEQIKGDLAAATAAVRGISTTAPEPDSMKLSPMELNDLSEAEFASYKQKLARNQG